MNKNFVGCMVFCAAIGGCHAEINTSNETASSDNVSANSSASSIQSGDDMIHVPDIEPLVKAAIEDLSTTLEIPPSEIYLVHVERVTWRDGSLGCPKKGMMYTQALVDGLLIVLQAGGTTYQYHSGKGGKPFYCKDPDSPGPKASV